MKCLMCGLFIQIIITDASLEPLTSIQIQNYDGPIYLHAPMTTCQDEMSNILHASKENCRRPLTCDTECNCVSKQSPKCIPINTASESSCYGGYYVGAYPQYSNAGCYPGQDGTQIYYSMDAQWSPTSYIPREDKCPHRCCKCGYTASSY